MRHPWLTALRTILLGTSLAGVSLAGAGCERGADTQQGGTEANNANKTDDKNAAKPDDQGAAARMKPSDATSPDPTLKSTATHGAKAAPSGEVQPPKAEDLAEYTKDLPGQGPLMATIETTLGAFHCELYADKVPMTVANFVGLARGLKPWIDPKTEKVEKKPFYDGIIFHRVIPGFMVQTGDPLGEGTGGPGYQFDNETRDDLGHGSGGILSMANAGPGTNGSQFFITEKATPWLDGMHTVFGKCKEVDLVKNITRVPRDSKDRPQQEIKIERVTISRGS
jgi:peptidyl-prolyl cis-trans isomerase A (cyclophilin A)